MKDYDVIIIGAGVSGSALAYVLDRYTNVKRVAIIEKCSKAAQVNSNTYNNSQTLHFGDIETNYSLEKATKVKRAADMVKNFVDRNDSDMRAHSVYHKMVLAVGDEQVEILKKRYEDFKELFPNLRKVERDELARLEPEVVRGRDPKQKLLALVNEDGYTMDYQKLSELFLDKAVEGGKIDLFFNKKVNEVKKGKKYVVRCGDEEYSARALAVEAGAHSLLLAKSLGYGKEYSLLSIAGSFYLSKNKLNGKVYTMQVDKLPFAAIHGDPEVHDSSLTRFGPTAKALPMLERRNYGSVFEYFKTAGINAKAISSFVKILSDKVILFYLVKQFSYDIPFIGKRLFIKEVREVIPSMKLNEIWFAKGYGGVRPQIVNTAKKSLDLGQAKILGDNIIFNITPSPGATNCLKNAEDDATKLVEFLGRKFKFNRKKFDKEICF